MRVNQVMRVLVIGAAGVALAGCGWGAMQGVNPGRKVDKTTAQFRYEAELIPNSSLAREDTSPDWAGGRYAFTNGADRLLVVSRITSFEEVDPKTDKPLGRRLDRDIERAWITIPFDFPAGMPLSVEAQEAKFLVGYDKTPGRPVGSEDKIANDNQFKFFIDPNTIKGKITVQQEGVNTASIHVNIDVSPQRYPRWRVNDVFEVPITTVGIWARRARPELTIAQGGRLVTPETQPAVDDNQPGSRAVVGPMPPTTQAGGGAATQPALAVGGSATQPVERSIVGHWVCPRTEKDNSEYRFQFDVNGTCVFTTQRPGFTPVPRYGKFQIKKNVVDINTEVDFVVINVERAEPGLMKMPYLYLKLSWTGSQPVLKGDLFTDPQWQNRTLVLQQGNFADMNTTLPQ
jgi:hypothetical protein